VRVMLAQVYDLLFFIFQALNANFASAFRHKLFMQLSVIFKEGVCQCFPATRNRNIREEKGEVPLAFRILPQRTPLAFRVEFGGGVNLRSYLGPAIYPTTSSIWG